MMISEHNKQYTIRSRTVPYKMGIQKNRLLETVGAMGVKNDDL